MTKLQEDKLSGSPPGVSGVAEQQFFDADRASHEYKMRGLEIGWIGRPFGGGAEKSSNIAMLTIFICLFVAALLCYHYDLLKQSEIFSKLVSPFLNIATLALGYLFGSSKKK